MNESLESVAPGVICGMCRLEHNVWVYFTVELLVGPITVLTLSSSRAWTETIHTSLDWTGHKSKVKVLSILKARHISKLNFKSLHVDSNGSKSRGQKEI